MYFTNYAIENNGRVTVSPEDGTITFAREKKSDQEYLQSIPGLWESIEQASQERRSGKYKGNPLDLSSFEAFEASI